MMTGAKHDKDAENARKSQTANGWMCPLHGYVHRVGLKRVKCEYMLSHESPGATKGRGIQANDRV